MIDRTVSLSLDHLHWTTREGVAATLIAIADGGSEEAARRALLLLRAAATPDTAPQLVRLALRRDLAPRLRDLALAALAATGVEAPDEALAAFLAEQPLVPVPWPENPVAPALAKVVALARTPSHRRLVRAFLDRAGHAVIAELLSEGVDDDEIRADAHRRWLVGVDLERPGEEDAAVVRVLRDMDAASARVLRAYLRARRGEPGFHPRDAFYGRAVVYALDPEEQLVAARRLDLDLRDLIELLGPGELARTLRAAVHDHSFSRSCPVERADTEARYHRALWLLRHWPEGHAIVLRLLSRAALHPEVEADLAGTLAWGDRASARRLLALRLRRADPAALGVVRAILRVLRQAPLPDDREVLRAALAIRDTTSRCLAIEALDELGDDGGALRDILRSLAARPEPFVPLAASRALARRGEARFMAPIHAARTDPHFVLRIFAIDALTDLAREPALRAECVAALADSAVADPETRIRAEAVHGLARAWAAGEHLDLLEHALLDDPGREGRDDPMAPVCDSAAISLCIAGGERAREALLRAAFVVPERRFHAIDAAFDVIVTCPDGTPEERLERLKGWGHGFGRTGYWCWLRMGEEE